jgi:two-component system, NtrC family, sensor kinase
MTLEEISVLVVDDRDANRYPTTHALTQAGFKVSEAATGKEALELARKLPTVIVLDVKLPDILGYEVCRRIKSNAQTRHIPVLMLSSAFLDNESKLYALESGGDGYLIQPADPVVLVATVRSLARLHRAESRAHLAAKQWQATFDSLNEGVAILDADGKVQRCNRAMTQLLNKTYSDIEDRSFHDLATENLGLTNPLPHDGGPLESQKDNRFFRLGLNSIGSDRSAGGSVVIVAEITKQKLAEQALLVSERLAATGRTAHTIAHEINNPLEAITNLVYLLQNTLDNPEVSRKYLNSTAEELARVSRISRQILSFNREAATPVQTKISELIDDVLALNNRAVVDKNIRVIKDWDGALAVEGYPAQLRQVFSNVVRNAIEASFPGREIRIRISSTRMARQNEPAVRVTIADQGVGIAPENIKRVFDAFFTTKELKGSGVGLWLSTSIVQQHGGFLRVRSCTRPQHSGTCLAVVLPCRMPAK